MFISAAGWMESLFGIGSVGGRLPRTAGWIMGDNVSITSLQRTAAAAAAAADNDCGCWWCCDAAGWLQVVHHG